MAKKTSSRKKSSGKAAGSKKGTKKARKQTGSSKKSTSRKKKASSGKKKTATKKKATGRKKSASKKKSTAKKKRPSKKKTAGKKTPAKKSTRKKTTRKKKKAALGRPKIPGDARLDILFRKDYEARQIFEFLGVTTVRELEQYPADEIIQKLTAPVIQTVGRIRIELAGYNRALAGDKDWAAEHQARYGK